MKMLYPTENPMVERKSSIDQFDGFLSVIKQNGSAPIVFDQLDGITCNKIKTHPIVIDFSNDGIGYVFPEAKCRYFRDKFVTFDKHGVEEKILPACMGQGFYQKYIDANAFINFDDDTSVGTHTDIELRVGLDYCLSNKTLPSAD